MTIAETSLCDCHQVRALMTVAVRHMAFACFWTLNVTNRGHNLDLCKPVPSPALWGPFKGGAKRKEHVLVVVGRVVIIDSTPDDGWNGVHLQTTPGGPPMPYEILKAQTTTFTEQEFWFISPSVINPSSFIIFQIKTVDPRIHCFLQTLL